ncbi:MAG: ankyrin repeat domain-containing protein, partial [Candidatus Marinimicrobia bacterium]|nr:ankyrin repeat domain-containing protein [Candidatus Neomarinimicrobiota bacterium]
MINRLFTLMIILAIASSAGCGRLWEKPQNNLSLREVYSDPQSYGNSQDILYRVKVLDSPRFRAISAYGGSVECYTTRVTDGTAEAPVFFSKRRHWGRKDEIFALKGENITVSAALTDGYAGDDPYLDIIEFGAGWQPDTDWPQTTKDALLLAAVRVGDMNEIRALVDAGGNVNGKNNVGDTPLHLVANQALELPDSSTIQIAQYLIENGAKLTERNYATASPLGFAM